MRSLPQLVGFSLLALACGSESSTYPEGPGGASSEGMGGAGAATGGQLPGSGGSPGGGAPAAGGAGGTGGVVTTSGGSPAGGSPPAGGVGGTAGGGVTGGAGGGVTGGSGGGVTGGSGGVATGGAGGGVTGGSGGGVTGGAGGGVTGGAGGDTGGAAATGGGGTGGEGTGGDATGGTTSGDVTVQLAQTRQLIRGFGINNNWAGAMSSQVADRLFGTGNQQLGFNILRVGMGSDGEPYNGSNCYADINAAVSRGAEYIIGTLWSPPANCKTNNSITDGGHLLESCYESWSTTIANFADKISQNTNTTLYAMAPQNEVDFASCGTQEPCNGNYDTTVFTGDEAAAFQKIVGPKIRAKGVIPMSPEASEWIHVWSNESACCSEPSGLPSSDPLNCGFPPDNCPPGAPFEGYEYGYALYADSAAWDAFDILGVHQYDSQISYAWPSDVPKGNKEVWQTEMSGVKWWPEQGETNAQGVLTGCSTHIQNGVAVARWIWHALTVGEANAWLYWWYQALSTDDNEGLLCSDGRVAKRLWTMGQYSKFIRPGHHIVDITGNVPANVMLVASLGQDSSVVVVAANETDSAVDLPITIAGGTAPTGMDVWQTSASDDLASKSAVTVTGGTFTASLPAMSVTTFVSQ